MDRIPVRARFSTPIPTGPGASYTTGTGFFPGVKRSGRNVDHLPPSSKGKKGKSVPLQAWSGPEGSRKLRFPDYITTAQDGGKVVSLTHRPPSSAEVNPLNIELNPICQ